MPSRPPSPPLKTHECRVLRLLSGSRTTGVERSTSSTRPVTALNAWQTQSKPPLPPWMSPQSSTNLVRRLRPHRSADGRPCVKQQAQADTAFHAKRLSRQHGAPGQATSRPAARGRRESPLGAFCQIRDRLAWRYALFGLVVRPIILERRAQTVRRSHVWLRPDQPVPLAPEDVPKCFHDEMPGCNRLAQPSQRVTAQALEHPRQPQLPRGDGEALDRRGGARFEQGVPRVPPEGEAAGRVRGSPWADRLAA